MARMRRNGEGLWSVPFIIGLALASLCTHVCGKEAEGEEARLTRGRDLYRVYCGNCHGESGKGDGPAAELLLVRPADLTRLGEKNDGTFPFDRVLEAIDGRAEIRGHDPRKMPIWGIALQEWDKDAGRRDEVAGRILQLTRYLRSIQEPAEK